MSAFAAAVGTLVGDPNMGVDALFRSAGNLTDIALRVTRSSPDQLLQGLGGTTFKTATDVLTVPAASLGAAPAAGDTFRIGGQVLVVLDTEADAGGTSWRVECNQ